MNLEDLKKPFPAADIEWRVQSSGMKNGKPWLLVLAYVTNRAVQDRLDDVCGPENWKNRYDIGPSGGIVCGISIRIDGEWVEKWDGAENTKHEAIKGGLSGSMKRAVVQWGIGRYLYNLSATFAVVNEKGQYSDVVYPTKAEQKKKQNGQWIKWNPPALPKWALPEGEKAVTPEPPENKTKPQRETSPKSTPESTPKTEAGKWVPPKDYVAALNTFCPSGEQPAFEAEICKRGKVQSMSEFSNQKLKKWVMENMTDWYNEWKGAA